jgi:thiosulfate/3-mercaptopyruvate sulfurtransferase
MDPVTSPTPQFTAPLLTPRRLAALLDAAVLDAQETDVAPATAPLVLDVRWRLGGPPGRADHEAGHVPGAVFVDLDTELAAPPGAGGRHPLPDPAVLQEVLRRAGVSQRSRVVAYDDDTGAVAARAWWLLRWSGLPAERVAVLDGGFRAWVADGLPVTTAPSRPAAGDVVVRPGGMPVVDADGAAELPGTACCSMHAQAPGTGGRPNRSTRRPGTSPGRATPRPPSTSARTAAGCRETC